MRWAAAQCGSLRVAVAGATPFAALPTLFSALNCPAARQVMRIIINRELEKLDPK